MSKRKDRKGSDQPNATTHQRDGPNRPGGSPISREEFERRFGAMGGSLLATSYRILGNIQDAQDTVQDGATIALKKMHQLKDPEKLEAWLTRIVQNLALEVRSRRRISATFDDDSSTCVAANSSLRHEIADADEAMIALGTLDEGDRAIIRSRLFDGLSNDDIADREGITASGATMRFKRAIERLRGKLSASTEND